MANNYKQISFAELLGHVPCELSSVGLLSKLLLSGETRFSQQLGVAMGEGRAAIGYIP